MTLAVSAAEALLSSAEQRVAELSRGSHVNLIAAKTLPCYTELNVFQGGRYEVCCGFAARMIDRDEALELLSAGIEAQL